MRSASGAIAVTDNGNYLVDCPIGDLPDPKSVEVELRTISGVVETGIFIGLVDILIVSDGSNTEVRQIDRSR